MYYPRNFGVFWLIGAIVVIIPFWRICRRVGLSPLWSLLMAVPLLNLVFVYYLAFTEWPSSKGTVVPGT